MNCFLSGTLKIQQFENITLRLASVNKNRLNVVKLALWRSGERLVPNYRVRFFGKIQDWILKSKNGFSVSLLNKLIPDHCKEDFGFSFLKKRSHGRSGANTFRYTSAQTLRGGREGNPCGGTINRWRIISGDFQ